MEEVVIIGAGLAGVEAAWHLARHGLDVTVFEARPKWTSPAHKTHYLAELVCSNSLRSEEEGHASALLKEEMRALGSLLLMAADNSRVPAGKALAVDRNAFSEFVTDKITKHPNIKLVREEVVSLKDIKARPVVISSGPLTSPSLEASIKNMVGDRLYFYDAIAPIVEADSIDANASFRASRYGAGAQKEGDYINCPMTKDEYERFIHELLEAKKIQPHAFDQIVYFEGCMPIEVMAGRHIDALRHGPMKPVGFIDPRTGSRPYAVVQLRQENTHATLYNIVGFQTRMTCPEQDRVLRLIPALRCAKFERHGSMHRNTYVNGPALLDETLQLKDHPGIYMAGQITGVEGYLESAAMGLYVGFSLAKQQIKRPIKIPPPTTAIGALIHHVTKAGGKNYQPMKMMWGLFPCEAMPRKCNRKEFLLSQARTDFKTWL